jgi:hypothetical protein
MMSKRRPCQYCGKEVAKSAKVCPSCGQELKMGSFAKLLPFAIVGAVLFALVGVVVIIVAFPGARGAGILVALLLLGGAWRGYHEYRGKTDERNPHVLFGMNVYGLLMLAISFVLGYGIAYLTGTQDSPLWYVGTGALAAVLDLAYRLKNASGHWFHPDGGGSLLFFPVWLYGAFLMVYGVVLTISDRG